MNHDKEILKFYVIATMVLSLLILLCLPCFAQVDTTKAVIHHTATDDVSIDVIRNYHVNVKGWDDVGYHRLIRKDGTIEKGRSLSKKGAHAKGRNHLVGIALTGYDTFTVAQINSLKKLLLKLGVVQVEPHHKNCPGDGLSLQAIQQYIDDSAGEVPSSY